MINSLMSPTILVTGGTGFAGSHLVELLLKNGETNIHVTSNSGSMGALHHLLSPDRLHQIDLTDSLAVMHLFERLQPTHIYHLAALSAVGTSFEKIEFVLQNNIRLQLAILEAIRTVTPEARTLIIGSGLEYDTLGHPASFPIDELHPLGPSSPYASSKVMQDILALSFYYTHRLNLVRVRPFNHIGERQSTDFAVPSFARQIALIEIGQQSELTVGNLNSVRDFTDVLDMVQAYHILMEKGEPGQVYNVGSGVGISMKEVLEILCSMATVEIPIRSEENLFRPLDMPILIANAAKIGKLGWKPSIPLHETLERIMYEWRVRVRR